MHDLVHDLAQNVAGEESKLLDIKCPIGDESSTQITDGLVHVNLLRSKAPPSLFVAKRLRSLLLKGDYNNLERLISRFQYLRVLMVEDNWITKLPNSIGRMIHLRYLKIEYKAFKSQTDLKKTLENLQTLIDLKGWNNVSSLMDFSLTHRDLEYLPDSITRLENLQTLNLEHYNALRELPSDLTKLVNLRHLLLPSNSSEWTDFPSGFGNLTSLQELNWFIVGKSNGIDSLPLLSHRGGLKIRFCEWRRNATSEAKRAALKNNDELTSLELWFEEKVTPAFDEMNEMLMHLQLPPNIWELKLRDYKGDAMPTRWLQGLSMLVSIEIEGCKNCKTVPHLSQLPSLKIFQLIDLEELEYVEDEDNVLVGSSGGKLGSVAHNVYFPSLEMLCMIRLPRLKGWTRTSKDDGERRQMLFPQLLEMIVDGCPELISMPVAPKLKSLDVQDIQWKVFESNVALHGDEEAVAASQSSLPPSLSTHFTSLQKLIMDSVEVVWLSISLSNLAELKIKKCEELRRVKFESPNSIQLLKVKKCRRLREIKGWEHLSMLDTLIIEDCEELEMEEEAEDEATNSSSSRCWQWQGLSSLRELKLSMIPKLKKLPSGIVCLTTLQELNISELESLTELPQDIGNLSLLSVLWIVTCPELKSLPTSLLGLTSLETLAILDCPDVAKKCEEPDGEYCHFIQRIPFLISGACHQSWSHWMLTIIMETCLNVICHHIQCLGHHHHHLHQPFSQH
ncbi:putative disease resistance protein RGA4 [Bienertia sinuspersici]